MHNILHKKVKVLLADELVNEMGAELVLTNFYQIFIDVGLDLVEILEIQEIDNSLQAECAGFVRQQLKEVFLKRAQAFLLDNSGGNFYNFLKHIVSIAILDHFRERPLQLGEKCLHF